MKRALCLVILTSLAACGIDGEPVRPTANVGVSVGSGGVSTSGSIGVSAGPLTVGVGLF